MLDRGIGLDHKFEYQRLQRMDCNQPGHKHIRQDNIHLNLSVYYHNILGFERLTSVIDTTRDIAQLSTS